MRRVVRLCACLLAIGAMAALLYRTGVLRARTNADWTEPFRAAAVGADRLVVQEVSWTRQRVGRPDFEIRGTDTIRELFELIEIDAAGSGDHCDCIGDYRIHVYRADERLMTFSYHHGKSLRWRDGPWSGDGRLTSASQASVPRWFKEHGYPALYEDRETALAEEKQAAASLALFVAQFPRDAQACFRPNALGGTDALSNDEALGKRLAAIVDNPRQLAVAVCRAFGTLHGRDADWSSTGSKERRALTAVHTVSADDFVAALEEIQGDRNALRGAARIHFYEKLDRQMDPDVRTRWTLRLAAIVLDEDFDENRRFVIGRLSCMQEPEAEELLRNVRSEGVNQ